SCGYDATASVNALADQLPEKAWKKLERPPRYQAQGAPRRRPDKVKEEIVRQRGFETLRLRCEDVAEFNYRPTACRNTYRMIVVRKNISKEKGEQRLIDEIRYFFYLSNDWVPEPEDRVLAPRGANGRCHQDGAVAKWLLCLAGAGGQPGKQLGVYGDDGLGVEPESLVGAAVAGGAWPLAGA